MHACESRGYNRAKHSRIDYHSPDFIFLTARDLTFTAQWSEGLQAFIVVDEGGYVRSSSTYRDTVLEFAKCDARGRAVRAPR